MKALLFFCIFVKKTAMINTKKYHNFMIVISSFFRNLFVILKRKKSHTFMTQEELTAKEYVELLDKWKKLRKELKEVDLQMKIIERSVVQNSNKKC